MRPLLLATLALTCLGASTGRAQSEGVLPIESGLERFLLRQHALGRTPGFDPGARPVRTALALALLDSIDATALTAVDRRLLDGYLGREAAGVLGPWAAASTPFYNDRRTALSAAGDGYAVEGGLLLDATWGPARINRPATASEAGAAWTFSRGLRAAGRAGRLFVETRITENQELVPLGPRTYLTAPRRGNAVTTGDLDPRYDYIQSMAIVGYRDRFVEVRAGRDRNRLGVARGSLILSDYATEYDHVQARVNFGPVAVQSVYARFLDPRERGAAAERVVEQRYGVFHRVSWQPSRSVEIEAFEAVLFGDRDDDNRNGFEPAYLVPFGFYRAVERDLGSPDNVLIGAGGAWRATPGLRLYGQMLLDELTAKRFFEDAWTNKWGIVLGAEIADPRLPGLGTLHNTDLRLEYARIRPYVYGHRDSLTAAVHYGDGLGHPAGPNAVDLALTLAHRPSRTLELWADLSATWRGRNTPDVNYGADPQRPYTDRRAPEPNPTLQGVRQRVFAGEAGVSLQVLPDVAAGLSARTLLIEDALEGRSGVLTPQVFVRWGLVPIRARY